MVVCNITTAGLGFAAFSFAGSLAGLIAWRFGSVFSCAGAFCWLGAMVSKRDISLSIPLERCMSAFSARKSIMKNPSQSPLPKSVRDYLSSCGRLGGRSTSPVKSAAARANGRKGGRPRKPRCVECVCWNKPNCYPPTMAEWNCASGRVDDPAQVCPRFGRVGKPLYRFDYNERSESKAASAKRSSKQKKS